jgi:hypothetical protein
MICNFIVYLLTDILWSIFERERLRGERGSRSTMIHAVQSMKSVTIFSIACHIVAIPTMMRVDDKLPDWQYGIAAVVIAALELWQLWKIRKMEKFCER